ncbi:type IV pilin protein [Ramlibacter rhizophilus]|uniref:Prepilin-type N-terminal cleavage/methylation domain-containing protein n=1 Tax=Ramlibacter rhizophilus TaxID=1781167 RepID=A0A4Z0BQM2_9BURK|nr:type IV pilin protein [Ramlibacter rhizophilus]TFZ01593.1 prepilin-type N-terminal cleavage/methylation domain-containing protein [Ramlibacter rhizophilus]
MFKQRRAQRGFTLIELMIAVAVVAILAAVAYPSFMDQIRKSRRAEAQQFLMEVASRQQQWMLDRRFYSPAAGTSNACAALSSELNVNPPSSLNGHYTFCAQVSISTASPPTFSVQAIPQGGQLKDSCGTLAVSQIGAKSPVNCW